MASFSSGFSHSQTASNRDSKNRSQQSRKKPEDSILQAPVFSASQDVKSLAQQHWQMVEMELLLNQIDRDNADSNTITKMQRFDRLWSQVDGQTQQAQYLAKPLLDDMLKRFNSLVNKHWEITLNDKNHPINRYPQLLASEGSSIAAREQAQQANKSMGKVATKGRSNGIRSLFQSAGIGSGNSLETETELAPPCELGFTPDQLRSDIESLWQSLNQNPNAHRMAFEELRHQFNAPLLSQQPQMGEWLFQQWQKAPGPLNRVASEQVTGQLLKRLCPCPACQNGNLNPIRDGT